MIYRIFIVFLLLLGMEYRLEGQSMSYNMHVTATILPHLEVFWGEDYIQYVAYHSTRQEVDVFAKYQGIDYDIKLIADSYEYVNFPIIDKPTYVLAKMEKIK